MHTAKKPTERSRFALHMPVFWIIWHCILPWTNWALSAWLKCASHLVYIPQLQRLNYQCVRGMQISDYPHFPTTLPALHLSGLPNRLPTALLALHSDSYFKFSQPGSPIFYIFYLPCCPSQPPLVTGFQSASLWTHLGVWSCYKTDPSSIRVRNPNHPLLCHQNKDKCRT